jgi:hypothetical protein
MAEYNIYVIELDKEVLSELRFRQKNPDYDHRKPCVYVGQTAKSPKERFRQHLAGIRSNRYVYKYGIRLRPRLYEKINPLPDREKAERKEALVGQRLRKRGYGVWWN